MDMQNLQKQKGFTLVEIAIVLVIIGLLLGGVLKGQELIENTKIKSVKSDADNMVTAINGYQDRFRAIPGDDANADTNVTGTVATAAGGSVVGNGLIEGQYDPAAVTNETAVIFEHLRLAGFISGNDVTQPTSAFGGILGVSSAAAGMTGLIICQTGLTEEQMQLVDIRYDDGSTLTGTIRGATDAAGTATAVDYGGAFDSIALCINY